MIRNIIYKLQKWYKQLTCKHIYVYGCMRTPGKFTKYMKTCTYCNKRVVKPIN